MFNAEQTVALEWLRLVVEGDIDGAWPHTAFDLQLSLVQHVMSHHWVALARPSRAALERRARALAQEGPAHSEWPAMRWRLQRFLSALNPGGGPWRALPTQVTDWGYLVRFVAKSALPTEAAPGAEFLMVEEEGHWLVLNLGEKSPVPGWPPDFRLAPPP